jgi:hypothetical protein
MAAAISRAQMQAPNRYAGRGVPPGSGLELKPKRVERYGVKDAAVNSSAELISTGISRKYLI